MKLNVKKTVGISVASVLCLTLCISSTKTLTQQQSKSKSCEVMIGNSSYSARKKVISESIHPDKNSVDDLVTEYQINTGNDTFLQSKLKESDATSYYIEDMPSVYQYPDLPTGCEATALTALMKYWGMDADKVDVAMKYMPKMDFEIVDGVLYGANFYTTFAGNPSTESGFGCYVPCIVKTAENFMQANGYSSEYKAINLNGTSLDELLHTYVANDIPVLVISTEGMEVPYMDQSWLTPDGYELTWQVQHHAVVIYGYNYNNETISVMNPANSYGFSEYDLSEFEEIYRLKSQNAMIIEKNSEIHNATG